MVEIDIEDPDKHERVVKALAQINGLRYRTSRIRILLY
jgi:hypothetical protein